jgi:hypothetical protein
MMLSGRDDDPNELMTRREYMFNEALLAMADEGRPSASMLDLMVMKEAIATTALEHPEWNMDEAKTLAEWRANDR